MTKLYFGVLAGRVNKDKYAKILELYIEDCKNQFKEICKLKGNITNRVSALIENIYYSVAELSSSYQDVFIDELKKSIGQDCNYANWIKDDNSRKSKEPIDDADMDTLRDLIKKIKDAKETKGTKENSVGKESVEGGSLSEKIYETINNAEI